MGNQQQQLNKDYLNILIAGYESTGKTTYLGRITKNSFPIKDPLKQIKYTIDSLNKTFNINFIETSSLYNETKDIDGIIVLVKFNISAEEYAKNITKEFPVKNYPIILLFNQMTIFDSLINEDQYKKIYSKIFKINIKEGKNCFEPFHFLISQILAKYKLIKGDIKGKIEGLNEENNKDPMLDFVNLLLPKKQKKIDSFIINYNLIFLATAYSKGEIYYQQFKNNFKKKNNTTYTYYDSGVTYEFETFYFEINDPEMKTKLTKVIKEKQYNVEFIFLINDLRKDQYGKIRLFQKMIFYCPCIILKLYENKIYCVGEERKNELTFIGKMILELKVIDLYEIDLKKEFNFKPYKTLFFQSEQYSEEIKIDFISHEGILKNIPPYELICALDKITEDLIKKKIDTIVKENENDESNISEEELNKREIYKIKLFFIGTKKSGKTTFIKQLLGIPLDSNYIETSDKKIYESKIIRPFYEKNKYEIICIEYPEKKFDFENEFKEEKPDAVCCFANLNEIEYSGNYIDNFFNQYHNKINPINYSENKKYCPFYLIFPNKEMEYYTKEDVCDYLSSIYKNAFISEIKPLIKCDYTKPINQLRPFFKYYTYQKGLIDDYKNSLLDLNEKIYPFEERPTDPFIETNTNGFLKEIPNDYNYDFEIPILILGPSKVGKSSLLKKIAFNSKYVINDSDYVQTNEINYTYKLIHQNKHNYLFKFIDTPSDFNILNNIDLVKSIKGLIVVLDILEKSTFGVYIQKIIKDINDNTIYFDDNPIPKMVIFNKIDLLPKEFELNEAINICSPLLLNGFNIIYQCSMKKYFDKIDNALLRIKTEIIQRINYKELGYFYIDETRINLIKKKVDLEGRKIKFEVIGQEKVGKTSLERRLLMMPFEKNIFDLNKIDTLKDRSEFNLTYNYQEGKYKLDMIFSKNGDDEPSNVDCYILLYDVGKEETMVLPKKIKNLAKKNNSFIIVLGNKFDDEYPNLNLENEKLKLKKFVEENECESGYIISCKKFKNIKYLTERIIDKVNFYNNIKNNDLKFYVQSNSFYIRIIGDIKTGKTQLLNRLMNEPFEEKYETTRKIIEFEKVDEYTHYYDIIDNKYIHFFIEVYNGTIEKIIKTDLTKGIFLVVVDMTDEKSLEYAYKYMDKVRSYLRFDHSRKVLIKNKMDLVTDELKIPDDKFQKFLDENYFDFIFDYSCKKNENLNILKEKIKELTAETREEIISKSNKVSFYQEKFIKLLEFYDKYWNKYYPEDEVKANPKIIKYENKIFPELNETMDINYNKDEFNILLLGYELYIKLFLKIFQNSNSEIKIGEMIRTFKYRIHAVGNDKKHLGKTIILITLVDNDLNTIKKYFKNTHGVLFIGSEENENSRNYANYYKSYIEKLEKFLDGKNKPFFYFEEIFYRKGKKKILEDYQNFVKFLQDNDFTAGFKGTLSELNGCFNFDYTLSYISEYLMKRISYAENNKKFVENKKIPLEKIHLRNRDDINTPAPQKINLYEKELLNLLLLGGLAGLGGLK